MYNIYINISVRPRGVRRLRRLRGFRGLRRLCIWLEKTDISLEKTPYFAPVPPRAAQSAPRARPEPLRAAQSALSAAREFENAQWNSQISQTLLARGNSMKTKRAFERTRQENCLGFNDTLHHVTLVHLTPRMDILGFTLVHIYIYTHITFSLSIYIYMYICIICVAH